MTEHREPTYGALWLSWFAVTAVLGFLSARFDPGPWGPGEAWVIYGIAVPAFVLAWGLLPHAVWIIARELWWRYRAGGA